MNQQQPCPAGASHRQEPTPAQRQRLGAQARSGKTINWLASHYGISPREVRRILRGRRKRTTTRTPSPPSETVAVAP